MERDHALAHAEDCGRAAVLAIARCAKAAGRGPDFEIWREVAIFHSRQAWHYACLAVAIAAEDRTAEDSALYIRRQCVECGRWFTHDTAAGWPPVCGCQGGRGRQNGQ